MRVLAIDTAGAAGSLACLEDLAVVGQRELHSPEGHNSTLFASIESLLAELAWPWSSLDGFAAGNGPGTFTGVRIGLAAAMGLAHALDRPVMGVSNLQALASCGSMPLRAALIDARRGQVYAAVYDADEQLLQPEVVISLADWLLRLPCEPLEFVSPALHSFLPILAASAFAGSLVTDGQTVLAPAIGRIAQRRWLGGDTPANSVVDANYVRRSDAELAWHESR